jgi:LmbE family N-acetylglucosaminyl deacetylase
MYAMSANQQEPFVPKVILGVAAHPDDLDFVAGGSIAQWIRQGATVYYFILTNGNKGTNDRNTTPDELCVKRRDEQCNAAHTLGVSEVFFADYDDGRLEIEERLKVDIARVIRKLKPDTVITYDPTMIYDSEHGLINHPDHRAAGQATLDAVYPLARDYLSCASLFTKEHLEPHKVSTVLLFGIEKTNFSVDISKELDTKTAALRAHGSQYDDSDIEAALTAAKENGALSGAAYAERFVRIDVR